MYLVKGHMAWQSLKHLTRHSADLPVWTPLTELPLKQLTSPIPAVPRVFYMPEQLPAAAARIYRLPSAA